MASLYDRLKKDSATVLSPGATIALAGEERATLAALVKVAGAVLAEAQLRTIGGNPGEPLHDRLCDLSAVLDIVHEDR